MLNAQSHFLTISKSSSLLQNSVIIKGALQEFVFYLIDANEHSLREVEKFIIYLEVYQSLSRGSFNTNDSHNVGMVLINILAVYCVCFFPEKAKKILTGEAVIPLIEEALKKDHLSKTAGYHNPADIVLALFYMLESCGEKFSKGNSLSEWKTRVDDWFSIDQDHRQPLFQDAIKLMAMQS